MSAMINAPKPQAWQIPFADCPCVMQLLTDIRKMSPTVLRHPLCADLAASFRRAGATELKTISLCLAHLDTCALHAARSALEAAGCSTGITINDSLTIYSDMPISLSDAAARASLAASNQHHMRDDMCWIQ